MRLSVSCASKFVPRHNPHTDTDLQRLGAFLKEHQGNNGILCLTGAGMSTESGIPDYRSEEVGLYATSKSKPMQYKDFVTKATSRKSYWARSFVGWPFFSGLKPNSAHRRLADWEEEGKIRHLVTQNVDGLHSMAGSKSLTELHGTNWTVKCLSCGGWTSPRSEFQQMLRAANPEYVEAVEKAVEVGGRSGVIRPDGDVDLPKDLVDSFTVPKCPRCRDGILMPDVVFFGDNVPKPRVDKVKEELRGGIHQSLLRLLSDSLLVIGSSLFVYSGYRFIVLARDLGKKVAVVNIGTTRADDIVDLKVNAKASDVLREINW